MVVVATTAATMMVSSFPIPSMVTTTRPRPRPFPPKPIHLPISAHSCSRWVSMTAALSLATPCHRCPRPIVCRTVVVVFIFLLMIHCFAETDPDDFSDSDVEFSPLSSGSHSSDSTSTRKNTIRASSNLRSVVSASDDESGGSSSSPVSLAKKKKNSCCP